MTGILVLEQSLNSLQFGLMLFLLAAGLTLVFAIMDMFKLAPQHHIPERGQGVWQGDSELLTAEPCLWQRYIGV